MLKLTVGLSFAFLNFHEMFLRKKMSSPEGEKNINSTNIRHKKLFFVKSFLPFYDTFLLSSSNLIRNSKVKTFTFAFKSNKERDYLCKNVNRRITANLNNYIGKNDRRLQSKLQLKYC